jgi:hypothetical protein
MGMISNYTRRSAGVLNNILKIIFERQLMSFFYLGDQKSSSAYNRLWRGAGTAMSCQPGVVGDPQRTLIQDFTSIAVQRALHHQRDEVERIRF